MHLANERKILLTNINTKKSSFSMPDVISDFDVQYSVIYRYFG